MGHSRAVFDSKTKFYNRLTNINNGDIQMLDSSRTKYLLGDDAMDRLHRAHVALFGVGGVGGAVFEALVRAGVGEITIIDGDDVAPSNLNRQLISDLRCIGRPKVDAAADRAAIIAPECKINKIYAFYLPENADKWGLDFSSFDYIADCIDTVSAKIDIITWAYSLGTPIISAMGAGNKLHPELFEIDDIYKTSVCPLARVMRRELRARGVDKLCVVYSKETAREYAEMPAPAGERGRIPPGSVSFVPPVAGYIMAGRIIRDICGVGD